MGSEVTPREKLGRKFSGLSALRPGVRLHLLQAGDDGAHAAAGRDRVIRNGDHDAHLEHELEEVGPEHAPQAAERDVEAGERDEEQHADGERRAVVAAPHRAEARHEAADVVQHRRVGQRGADDRGHRLGDPAEDDAVHQQAEIDRAKAAEERRRLAGIADLGELHIGEQSGAPPQPREEEDRHHSREKEAPPQPVARNALRVNEAGDDQRRVGGEGGGDHRGARQPPVHVASGDKVVVNALAGAAAKPQAEDEGDGEIADDGRPVEEGEGHKWSIIVEASSKTKATADYADPADQDLVSIYPRNPRRSAVKLVLRFCELHFHRLDLIGICWHGDDLAGSVEAEWPFDGLHQVRRTGRGCLLRQSQVHVALLPCPLVEAHDERVSSGVFLDGGNDHVVFLRGEERLRKGRVPRCGVVVTAISG